MSERKYSSDRKNEVSSSPTRELLNEFLNDGQPVPRPPPGAAPEDSDDEILEAKISNQQGVVAEPVQDGNVSDGAEPVQDGNASDGSYLSSPTYQTSSQPAPASSSAQNPLSDDSGEEEEERDAEFEELQASQLQALLDEENKREQAQRDAEAKANGSEAEEAEQNA